MASKQYDSIESLRLNTAIYNAAERVFHTTIEGVSVR